MAKTYIDGLVRIPREELGQKSIRVNLVARTGLLQNALREIRALGEKKIRVLIANPTRALRDFLYEAIRQEPGIEVVADVSDESAILAAAERTNPDCLIVPFGGTGTPPVCSEMLQAKPHVTIVAVGEGTDIVAIYWKTDVGEVRCTYTTASRKGILEAIHFTAA